MASQVRPEWLGSYATTRHDWHTLRTKDHSGYYRRIGIVESLFDVDGSEFEGRADITTDLLVELRTSLTLSALRDRILQAWSVLREKHVLLASRVVKAADLLPHQFNNSPEERLFVFEPNTTSETMLSKAKDSLTFVEDHYPQVSIDEFFIHTLNTGRCLDASKALSRLYVMPIDSPDNAMQAVHFILVAAHEITDGLTVMRWMSSFIDLLNASAPQLAYEAESLCSVSPVARLPPAQETLYPPITGSAAKERWSWALSRILRHTRKLPPAAFQNPLRRRLPLTRATPMRPEFPAILDYTHVPPINTFAVRAALSPRASQRLTQMCRDARISIGSGCFALVAVAMMLMEERRNPHVPQHERQPFVGSFPVNPRPFLTGRSTVGREDSLMLAFSEGVSLPFLPSDFDLDRRLRLLGRQADRQLRQYQKRPRSLEEEIHLGSKSPTQLLPLLYLDTMERLEARCDATRKRGWNVQGDYPASTTSRLATCGISSVGDRGSIIRSGKYDTRMMPSGKDIAADFRNLESNVRARDGEFLVGAVGDNGQLRFNASYDGCAIDPALAEEWKQTMETLLEPDRLFKL
ncbi:hypothetical protein A1O1_04852 [Capronia coronata CBS 617.96]|uniref:Condensation domain-containing protein n=1 Tax=Capronia coronata CBS 617.96 TaxID=1182541 RepID=W9YE54_9EURO|nr:uncharacterized protein A1O1_04852 [Capronia coronata CBS 617.96]EXJ87925.1 hypothetical protein A1O1_04852 [Capronia coronata CBS 617.96]